MANLGVISSLVRKNDLVLSDKLNHASLIEACKLSNAKLSIFKHNDMNDLIHKIKTKANRKFIITEGIFSMDGDFSNLNEISEISKKNNANISIIKDPLKAVNSADCVMTDIWISMSDKINKKKSKPTKKIGRPRTCWS